MACDSVAFETEVVERFLADGVLAGLVGDRVYTNLATAFPTLPVLRITLQPGSQDKSALDGRVYNSTLPYEIVAVGKGNDMAALKPIADQVDMLLAGQRIETAAFVARIVRQASVERTNVLEGTTRYSHLGAVYRVLLSVKY